MYYVAEWATTIKEEALRRALRERAEEALKTPIPPMLLKRITDEVEKATTGLKPEEKRKILSRISSIISRAAKALYDFIKKKEEERRKYLERLEAYVRELRERLKTAPPEERKRIEEELKKAEETLTWEKEKWKKIAEAIGRGIGAALSTAVKIGVVTGKEIGKAVAEAIKKEVGKIKPPKEVVTYALGIPEVRLMMMGLAFPIFTSIFSLMLPEERAAELMNLAYFFAYMVIYMVLFMFMLRMMREIERAFVIITPPTTPTATA